MGGLLYKDFVAVKGKKMVWGIVIATVLFTVLRMLFPGNADLGSFTAVNEKGEVVSFFDLFSAMGELAVICLGAVVINHMEPAIMEFDEKRSVRSYLFSMPVSRKKYVASKYIFIGIAMYIAFSVYFIWHVVSAAFMEEGAAANLSEMIAGFAVPFVCLLLFMAAVEMPMYFLLGKAKAMMIRVAFWMVLGFFAVGFLFFGNLALVENWDVEGLINWMGVHVFEMNLLMILSPVISLGLYYLSYRITSGLYERRELA